MTEGYSGHPYILNYCYNENEEIYRVWWLYTKNSMQNQYQINQTNDYIVFRHMNHK